MNGQFLEGILYDGKVMREFKHAETEPMASGVAGDGRKFPTIGPGTVQEWGQGGFPRVVTLSWTENLPNGGRRLDVTVPAG